MGAPQGTAGHLRPHRMKFLPGRMLGDTGNCTRGAWRALLPLRMKILPGRTALKTLELMSSSLLGIISRTVILL